MSQLQKTCSVTNGSQAISVLGDIRTRVLQNYVFMLAGDLVPYTVALDSTFDGARTQIVLTGAYQGVTNAAASGVFVTDFTYPNMLPVIAQGDVGTAAIFTDAMYKVQRLITVAAPAGLTAYQAVATAIDGKAATIAANKVLVDAALVSVTASAAAAAASQTATALSATGAATAKTNSDTAAAAALASKNAAVTNAATATAAAASATTSAVTATTASNQLTIALSQFRAVFVGSYPSAPTVDGNGNPLVNGAQYFDTTLQTLRIREAGVWVSHDLEVANATQNAISSAAAAAGSASSASTSATAAATSAASVSTQTTAAADSAASALASKNSATASQTSATASAAAAVVSASGVAASAAAATSAATSATTSASTAVTSSTGAAGSAVTASNAALTATTQATNAAASAASIASSVTASATNATNAAISATNAAASAASVLASQADALVSKNAAASSATAAASSVSTVATSAAAALASANTATTQATAAAASAAAALASQNSTAAFATTIQGYDSSALSSSNSAATSNASAQSAASAASASSASVTTAAGTATAQATAAAASASASASSAGTATTQATGAATSATNASISSSSAGTQANLAITQAAAAAASATSATSSATSATASASLATGQAAASVTQSTAATAQAVIATAQATAAATSATNSQASALKAADWADKTQNVQVETGRYSAKHWALTAQASSTGSVIYRGLWSAAGGTYPTTPALGDYYLISAAGTISAINYAVGDSIIYNGATWDKAGGSSAVVSVNGQTGTVVVTKSDVGLSAADNTSDANKPVSTAQATAIALKANISSLATVATSGAYSSLSGLPAAYSLPISTAAVLGGVKSSSSVLIDAAGVATVTLASIGALSSGYVPAWSTITGKPTTLIGYGITDAQAALGFTPYNATNPSGFISASGAPVQSVGTFTGAVTKTQLGINNIDNTSDANKPVSSAQATANTAVQTSAAADATTKADAANAAAQAASTPVAHVGSGGVSHAVATISTHGFLSSTDKTKLDGIAASATNYTHPANHPASIITQDTSNRFVTDVQITSWNGKQAALGYTAENVASRDVTGGYAGLTLFKLNLRNAANTITSWFSTAATAARTWTLPDKDGTVAMLSDITGTNSGTNTGDQSLASLGAQATLVSGTTIKTIGGASILGSGDIAVSAGITLVSYVNRATLRALTPVANDLRIVEGLGLFRWVSASTELDDDETAFATVGGVWEMTSTDPEYMHSVIAAEADEVSRRVEASALAVTTAVAAKFLRTTFLMSLTSLAATSSSAFVVPLGKAVVGDSIVVTPGNAFGTSLADQSGLSFSAYVSAADTVSVSIRNSSAVAAAMSASTWTVLVIKQ